MDKPPQMNTTTKAGRHALVNKHAHATYKKYIDFPQEKRNKKKEIKQRHVKD